MKDRETDRERDTWETKVERHSVDQKPDVKDSNRLGGKDEAKAVERPWRETSPIRFRESDSRNTACGVRAHSAGRSRIRMIPEKTVSADKGRFIGKAKACAADSHWDALCWYEKSDRDQNTRKGNGTDQDRSSKSFRKKCGWSDFGSSADDELHGKGHHQAVLSTAEESEETSDREIITKASKRRNGKMSSSQKRQEHWQHRSVECTTGESEPLSDDAITTGDLMRRTGKTSSLRREAATVNIGQHKVHYPIQRIWLMGY